jgi:glutamate-ammonia-ligase adenylyltransferase
LELHPPENLPAALITRFERVRERVADIDVELPPPCADAAARVLITSEFALTVLERYGSKLRERLSDSSSLAANALRTGLALDALDEGAAKAVLRETRHVELARIAWREIAGIDDTQRCLADLSALADGLVLAALDVAGATTRERLGGRYFGDATPPPMLVLAMGKLGGEELNFSSDIDVVFLYPDADLPDPAAVQPYYIRQAQTLIGLLDERTAQGIVYRTDARLRPFGNSGPLVVGLSAFESYLVSNGRDWERYAYVKARLLNGHEYQADVFDQILTPYVYRRYLDYGVIEALRQMKALIRREVARREMADNVKLGSGGIREIEFIVQAHQLVRGGRDPALRERSLLAALACLVDDRQLGRETVTALHDAYLYLRRLENLLQSLDDRQTHMLPKNEEDRARVAYALGANDWNDLLVQLGEHRSAVESAFDRVIADDETAADGGSFESAWALGTLESVRDELELDESSLSQLQDLRSGTLYGRMDEQSRGRLVAVLARTLRRLGAAAEPAMLLARILPIYRAICRRSAYLALLDENPSALENLIQLAQRSARLCAQIAAQPVLLDELLDPRIFDTPPTRQEFRALLRRQLGRMRGDDLESSLDAMRQFHGAALFRTAVADTLGQLPLMRVSDRLTDAAELIVEHALDLAATELEGKHGKPMSEDGERERGFAVVAYGKLGGYELGYGSDLDLVFLHDSKSGGEHTNGARSIDNAVYFARLAQRLIHFLSIQTAAGRLYEVDTRLRPSGQSGLLVSTLESFRRYQLEKAWVWEHQALLRSRAVAGSPSLCSAFERVRTDVLSRPVDRAHLRDEIIAMRARMRENLSKGSATQFDIKQDEGGLTDIEFLVDFLVLANASEHPALIEHPDNIRQLEALAAAQLLTPQVAERLKDCYLALRQQIHELALNDLSHIVDGEAFRAERASVRACWQEVFA